MSRTDLVALEGDRVSGSVFAERLEVGPRDTSREFCKLSDVKGRVAADRSKDLQTRA